MKRIGFAPVVALVMALVLSSCGGFTAGQGIVTVDGLQAGQLTLCGAGGEILQISGSGFLSEHGDEIIVEFTALQGTPFNGEASTQVEGIAISDSLVEALIPQIQGAAELTLTVILPGSNFGVSPPETIQLGGTLVGPFGVDDNAGTVTGNVTYNAAAPGVLLNDINSFCGDDESETSQTARGWLGAASRALLFNNLSVATPPVGFEDDATPGVEKMTTAMPGSGERGTVTIQSDGSWVYEPPLGYEGPDGFFYWVQEAGRPDPSRAFVSINVDKVVWFIRDTAANESIAFVGTGRFSDPFDSLFSFNNAQAVLPTEPFAFPPTPAISPNPDNAPQEGDCIFIYDNVITDQYEGGIRLRDQQKLIGEGVGLFLNNVQIVPPGTNPNPNPVLTNTIPLSGVFGPLPVVTLGNENDVLGIDIDQPLLTEGESQSPAGDGIFGFDVSGPTFIHRVNIRNMDRNGIHLQGISQTAVDLQGPATPVIGGIYQIGDPNEGGPFPHVSIENSGDNGIKINDEFFAEEALLQGPAQAAVNGLTVNVHTTDIFDSSNNGIEANDVNLNVQFVMIEGADVGIDYNNNQFGQLCTLFVENSNIGLEVLTGQPIFRGIQIGGAGNIQADIGFTSGLSEDTFLWGGPDFTGPTLEIAVHHNDFHSKTTALDIPTVNLFGSGTTVTSLEDLFITGNGLSEGMFFSSCTFDADPATMGIQAVPGGTSRIGTGVATVQRIEGTALRFFNCTGELTYTQLDIYQVGGDPSGILNTGTLTVNTGTFTIDHQP